MDHRPKVEDKTIKVDLGIEKDFLKRTQAVKEDTDKMNFIKIKNLCSLKDH